MHEFILVLTSDPDEDQADTMYAKFDDGTIATIQGVPQIHFHREAGSLEEAIPLRYFFADPQSAVAAARRLAQKSRAARWYWMTDSR